MVDQDGFIVRALGHTDSVSYKTATCASQAAAACKWSSTEGCNGTSGNDLGQGPDFSCRGVMTSFESGNGKIGVRQQKNMTICKR